jgi:tRNA(adenine34) deaminase
MCAGALHAARIDRCVYGAVDPKAGALGTLYDIASDERLNHRYEVVAGVRAEECAELLKDFFTGLRARGREPGPLEG